MPKIVSTAGFEEVVEEVVEAKGASLRTFSAAAVVEDIEPGVTTYYLDYNGKVWAWGSGTYGANGNGGTSDNLTPQLVQGLEGITIRDIFSKSNGAYALTDDGKVYSWGYGSAGANGNGGTTNNLTAQLVQGLEGLTIRDISTRLLGAYAITDDGKVYSWGRGQDGANGNGDTTDNLTAQLVQGLEGVTVKDIFPRNSGSYALTDDGKVYSWGVDSRGANGNGDTSTNLTAQIVEGLEGVTVKDVFPRFSGAYALTDDGKVYSWGRGTYGANGNGGVSDNLTAQLVQGLTSDFITYVATHSNLVNTIGLFIGSSGKVYSVGAGITGANGNGGTTNNFTAQLVQGLTGVVVKEVFPKYSSSGITSYALTDDGKVYSWGYGSAGANGNGGTTNNLTAQLVQGLEGLTIRDISTRLLGAYAITEDGKVYSWGRGTYGANGNGDTSTNLTAQIVQGLEGLTVKDLYSDDSRAYAFVDDLKIYGWGAAIIGAGSSSDEYTAVRILFPTTPKITTESLPAGTVDEEYSFQLEAIGDDPITWTATGLPDGMTISESGLISGTPTAAGGFSIVATATNANGTDTKTFPLIVDDIPTPPSGDDEEWWAAVAIPAWY